MSRERRPRCVSSTSKREFRGKLICCSLESRWPKRKGRTKASDVSLFLALERVDAEGHGLLTWCTFNKTSRFGFSPHSEHFRWVLNSVVYISICLFIIKNKLFQLFSFIKVIIDCVVNSDLEDVFRPSFPQDVPFPQSAERRPWVCSVPLPQLTDRRCPVTRSLQLITHARSECFQYLITWLTVWINSPDTNLLTRPKYCRLWLLVKGDHRGYGLHLKWWLPLFCFANR